MLFTYAILSAIFTGVQSYLNKESNDRKYDEYHVNAVSSVVSLIAAAVFLASATARPADMPSSLFWLGLWSGILYSFKSITQYKALNRVSPAIFFSFFKVLAQVFVLFISLLIPNDPLHDRLTLPQFIGVALSLFALVVLIDLSRKEGAGKEESRKEGETREEGERRKAFWFGLLFVVVCALCAAPVTILNAEAARREPAYVSQLQFMALSYAFTAGTSIGVYFFRHRGSGLWSTLKKQSTPPAIRMGLTIGTLQFFSFLLLLRAFSIKENVNVAVSIHANYILVAIFLAIFFQKESLNPRKAFAVLLSVVALLFLTCKSR